MGITLSLDEMALVDLDQARENPGSHAMKIRILEAPGLHRCELSSRLGVDT